MHLFIIHHNVQRYPRAEKFKDGHVLLHRDKLDLLFKGNAATSTYVIVPGSSVNKGSTTCQQEEVESEEVEGATTTPVGVDEPRFNSIGEESNKRKSQENTTKRGKSPRSTAMSDVHDSLNKKMEFEKEFINLIKYDIEENEANKARKEKYSMSRCKELLEKVGIMRSSVEFMLVSQLFTKPANRELFMDMDSPDERAR